MKLFWFCIVSILMVWGPASAHTKSQSFSSWSLQGADIVVAFQIDSRRVTLLRALDDTSESSAKRLSLHLLDTIHVNQGGADCRLKGVPQPRAAAEGYHRQELRFQCPSPGTWRGVDVTIDAFFPVSAQHVHFARARGGGGGWQEFIFSDAERQRTFTPLQSGDSHASGPAFMAYTILGIEHILEGLDHLAFVVGLLLLSRNVRQVLILLTGFTLGHSVTLALASLEIISPNIPVIEALIGFTIAFVAAEYLARFDFSPMRLGVLMAALLVGLAVLSWSVGGPLGIIVFLGLGMFVLCYGALRSDGIERVWLTPVLTIGFGLAHGAGFASVLGEIGLPQDKFVWALLGFNLGVELGQILVVACLAALWLVLTRLLAREHLSLATRGSATVLLALGVFWFVERSL